MRRLTFILLACLLWAGSASAQAVNTNYFCSFKKVITHEEIKALPLSAYTLVAGQAGRIIELSDIRFIMHLTGTDAPYTNVNESGSYWFVSAAGLDAMFANNSGTYFGNNFVTDMLEYNEPSVTYFRGFPNHDIGAPGIGPQPYTMIGDDDATNKPITLRIVNPTNNNFTGGSPDDILIVSGLFTVLNTTTGAFVACP